MELVGAIFVIIAGLVYLIWEYHKENPGAVSGIFVGSVVFAIGWALVTHVIPEKLAELNYNGHPKLSWFLLALLIIGIIVAVILFAVVLPKRWTAKELKESSEIWKEVMALPEPDIETLIAYRAMLGLPTYPRDDKVRNKAALDAWRREQYNIRYKKKHKFVVYF